VSHLAIGRRALAVLALASAFAIPDVAAAQFTTFVAHPPRAVDSAGVPTIALTDSARRARADSANRVAITNMKTWVDSAALAAGTRVPVSVDSTAILTDTTTRVVTTSDGMVAPDTGSPLPTIILAGLAAMFAGLTLLRRRA
jgi:hypothetical protein